jgi:hypothetical protein
MPGHDVPGRINMTGYAHPAGPPLSPIFFRASTKLSLLLQCVDIPPVQGRLPKAAPHRFAVEGEGRLCAQS